MAFGSYKVKGMDWHFGKDNNYQVVPKDEKETHSFISPDYLLQEMVTASENYRFSDKYHVGASKSSVHEFTFNMPGLSYEVDNELLYPQEGEVAYGLNTLNEFPPVDCGRAILPKRTGLLGDVLEQVDGLGSSGTTSIITPRLGFGLNTCSSTTEAPFMIPNDVSISCPEMGHVDEERSLEEMVLEDLESVANQMTKKSRICFRDALHRLANRSKHHLQGFQQNEELDMGMPSVSSVSHETLRYAGTNLMESETNAIDRTIANLMFNELKSYQQDLFSITSTRKEVLHADLMKMDIISEYQNFWKRT